KNPGTADYPCHTGTRLPLAHRPCRTRSLAAPAPASGLRVARAVGNFHPVAPRQFPLDQKPSSDVLRFALETQITAASRGKRLVHPSPNSSWSHCGVRVVPPAIGTIPNFFACRRAHAPARQTGENFARRSA